MHSVFSATFGFDPTPIAIQIILLAAYFATAIAARRAEAATEVESREERRAVSADRPVGSGRYTAAAKEQIARRLAPRRQGGPLDEPERTDSPSG